MGCRPGIGAEGLRAAGSVPKRRALFLDRDGVVNHDRGYTSSMDGFVFVEGVFDLCRAAVERGYLLFVVTNQAGIGRGYYTESDFVRLTHWMLGRFEAEGLPAPRVYYCPHHPTAGIGPYLLDCPCRKPNPGMLLAAGDECRLDLGGSVLVGDKEGDMQAGRRAGVGTRALLATDPDEAGPPAGFLRVVTLGEATARLFGPGGFAT